MPASITTGAGRTRLRHRCHGHGGHQRHEQRRQSTLYVGDERFQPQAQPMEFSAKRALETARRADALGGGVPLRPSFTPMGWAAAENEISAIPGTTANAMLVASKVAIRLMRPRSFLKVMYGGSSTCLAAGGTSLYTRQVAMSSWQRWWLQWLRPSAPWWRLVRWMGPWKSS